jgi:hypothetical protein
MHCDNCGAQILQDMADRHQIPPEGDWRRNDSDHIPQPAWFAGADHPQHCGTCGEYMYGENPPEEDDE